ncbi:MAG: flagellar motor switch protein FliN [Deltaproteobacteria bacterium]|nr:flagellar motor switch protein FliN [Deltaproteobacteria bacterium]
MDDIKNFDIAATVTESLNEVFEMMLSMELQLSDDQSQLIEKDERIVGSVSVGGRVMGCINIEVSREFYDIMTATMHDVNVEEIEGGDDVKDVIREMCNVVGGNLKSAFCDVGLICDLSPLCFTTGDDFKIESLNTVRHERYVFSHKEHIVIVEVGIRASEIEEGADEHAIQPAMQLKAVDATEVESFDVKTPVNEQIIQVFDTMLSMDLEGSEEDLKPTIGGEQLVGSVSFIGPLMGHFSIHVSKEFADQMTAAKLSIETEEVEGEEAVKDVIGELCNIIGGNLKSKFCDSGMICDLSTPSLTTGTNFKREAKDMVRYDRLSFCHGDIPVVVEVALKVGDDVIETQAAPADEFSQEDIDAPLSDERMSETAPVAMEGAFETEDQEADIGDYDTLNDEAKIDFILDIPLDVVVELGRNKMQINELCEVAPGSIVEFANLAGEPLDILVNGTLIAKGEIMVQGEKYGIRIVDILSRMERIRSMFVWNGSDQCFNLNPNVA